MNHCVIRHDAGRTLRPTPTRPMKTSQRRFHLHLVVCLALVPAAIPDSTDGAAPSLQPLLPAKWGGPAYDVKVSGKYAYVAAESAGLQVVVVSNPANCVRVGGYVTNGGRAVGVAVSGNYAYVADFSLGMHSLLARSEWKT